MDKILTDAIWKIRKNILPNATKPVTLIYTGGNTYQLYFATSGCHFACSMCNYGFDYPINVSSALIELDNICKNFPANAKILVLESSGSFLDEREIPKALRDTVLEKVSMLPFVKLVDIETHYTTVNENVLKEISQIFAESSKIVGFEFGVESANPDVLKLYNKHMNLNDLLTTIQLAESYGIEAELNFLTGAPMLSIKEQIDDAVNSMNWTFKNCPESTTCVMFPLNIKHNTLIEILYNACMYERISHWEFIEVLARIPYEYLERISIAWWGNRSNIYDGISEIIYPTSCESCYDALQTFYSSFYSFPDKEYRAKLLGEIQSLNCECHKKFKNLLESQKQPTVSISERFEFLKHWVQNNI